MELKKLQFKVQIKADKKKVWDLMLNPSTYQIWTTAFTPGSCFKGSWEKGSKITFLDSSGKGGMTSEIADNKPFEFISIRHNGEIKDGVEVPQEWAGALENYTFTEKDGGTEVTVEIDITSDWEKMFQEMWPKALESLKDMAERKTLITVEAVINAPVDKVWKFWSEPEHIKQWAFASDDWEAPKAENDLKVGGKFSTTMAAKDGSVSFDFGGTYDMVEKNVLMFYTMGEDGRKAFVFFQKLGDNQTKVTEVFEMETQNPEEMQRSGWQAIMDNFKKHVEAN